MTAEVGIMNRLGVALAADSAVTHGKDKIYTSADKLFQLTEEAPVGIMIYGNANFLGIPWETIIKIYRKQLGNQSFPKLEGYVEHFTNFLKSNRKLFPASAQKRFVESEFTIFCVFLRELLERKLKEESKEKNTLNEEDIKLIFDDLVLEQINQTKQNESLDQLPDNMSEILKKRYRSVFTSIRQAIFKNIPRKRNTNASLNQLFLETLTRQEYGSQSSGIVIAGFGENEHFPGLFELQIKGIAADQLLYRISEEEHIGENSDALVAPFAQKEMVLTFMAGIDPDLMQFIYESTTESFHSVSESILAEVKAKYPKFGKNLEHSIGKEMNNLLENLINVWQEKRENDYSNPVMEMVSALPKDELAAMAESLVNLTKFKRRVSLQQETVGGPIDVALITKGDGFVWVKRKHYFDKDLNPRVMAKYYQGGDYV